MGGFRVCRNSPECCFEEFFRFDGVLEAWLFWPASSTLRIPHLGLFPLILAAHINRIGDASMFASDLIYE